MGAATIAAAAAIIASSLRSVISALQPVRSRVQLQRIIRQSYRDVIHLSFIAYILLVSCSMARRISNLPGPLD